MREIVLDTETTGFKPEEGHRLIEIGCVELINHVETGETYHVYVNPERQVPAEAIAVHGLTDAFLADKPLFADVAAGFIEFIGDAALVIHNAAFDTHFLNWELVLAGYPKMTNPIVDTLTMARRKFPGSPATLDALCRRFGVDNSSRTNHGALLDSQLLAEVYLELLGGRQTGMELGAARSSSPTGTGETAVVRRAGQVRPPRPHAPTPEELEAHVAMLGGLKNPIWTRED